MNVFKCVVKVLALAGLVSLVGCASVESASKGTISNNKNGILYGYASTDISTTTKELCDSIKNSDARCGDAEKYQPVTLISSHGFTDGGYGVMALADNSISITSCTRPTFNDCTYYKVNVTPGKLGTILEVASKPKEGKCDWSGLNAAGGTVCPAYNWDYHKDNGSAVEY